MTLTIPVEIWDRIKAYEVLSRNMATEAISGTGIIEVEDDENAIVTDISLLRQKQVRVNDGKITLNQPIPTEARLFWSSWENRKEICNFGNKDWFVVLTLRQDGSAEAYLVRSLPTGSQQFAIRSAVDIKIDYVRDETTAALYEQHLMEALS